MLDLDRLKQLFVEARGLPGGERDVFVRRVRDEDTGLGRSLEELLSVDGSTDNAVLGSVEDTRAPRFEIEGYRIDAEIGRGGSGIVYRAEQVRTGLIVAVKILQPGMLREDLLRRLEREARLLATMKHVGIAQIYGAGSTDIGFAEVPYLVMELVDGVTLREYADRAELDVRARCALVAEVCDAIQHAHENGVIHRDLKPSNILVTEQDGEPVPKIVDFGIARSTDSDLATLQTTTGELMGTLPYMSPEQIRGEIADARTDVYALGVVLYQLLTGVLPLELSKHPLTEAVRLVNERAPIAIGRHDSALRGDLETVVHAALEKEKEQRFASPAALADDLRRWLRGEPVSARRPTLSYRCRKFVSRNRALVGTTLAIVLGLVVALLVTIGLASENRQLALNERAAKRELAESLYASQMVQAAIELQSESGVPRVREIVREWQQPRDVDNRGWEWGYLWAASHADERSVPLGEGFKFFDLHWDPEQRFVLGNYHGSRLEKRSLETGEILGALSRHSTRYSRSAISGDGRFVAFGEKVTELTVYEIESGKVVANIDVGSRPMSFCLDRTGSRVAWVTYEDSSRIRVRAVDDQPVREWTRAPDGGDERILRLAFSPDGTRLATVEPSRVVVWDCETGRVLRKRSGLLEFGTALAWNPGGDALAVGDREGSVFVLVASDLSSRLRYAHRDEVHDLRWHPDGQRIASASADQNVRITDVETGASEVLQGHGRIVTSVAWSPDGSRLMSSGWDANLRVWDPGRRRSARRTRVDLEPVRYPDLLDLQWMSDPNRLSLVHAGRGIHWDQGAAGVESGAGSWTSRTGSKPIFVRHDPEARVLTADGGVDRVLQRTPCPHLCFVAVHAEMQLAAIAGWSKVWLWDLRANELREFVDVHVLDLAFRPDGTQLALLTNNRVEIRSTSSGAVDAILQEDATGRPTSVRWHPDGDMLVVGCKDHRLRLFDGRGRPTRELLGHTARVTGVAVSPDGERVASIAADRTLRIWATRSGREAFRMSFEAEPLVVDWHREGAQIAVCDSAGWLHVLDASDGLDRMR